MKNMRLNPLKSVALASILTSSVAFALPFVDIEGGVNVGTDFNQAKSVKFDKDTSYTIGGYARLWFKPVKGLRIAPFIKYENTAGMTLNNLLPSIVAGTEKRDNNLQYGVLIGYKLFKIFTPYIGMGYSQFLDSNLTNGFALNYGFTVKFPIVPIAFGIDGSWQQPNLGAVQLNVHRIGATVGVQF